MFDNYDAYSNDVNDAFNFSPSEWAGLIIAGNVAAGISFLANSIVLFLHGFMLWYKPVIVNRLSLRMIVLSCIFNMIYCTCQLVTDDISSISLTCRALAFVMISSDTMACMCLAMVGLNLVTIFVFKVSRSMKLEIFYYCFIILSGVLVVVVPILVGPVRGPKNKEVLTSCWYHFFFDGRLTNFFNWMWYYGWILFSLAFAALCAAISIRFVMKKQDNFAGTLDMFTRRSKIEMSQINTLKVYANNNTDIFTKIARRCICYPLVPFFSKSWGVAIEIAAIQGATIPYEIFILDRTFSCLLGFMVSCIYFTDPAIGAVLQDFKDGIKKKYVFDYYSVKFQPGTDPTIQVKSQYPQLVSVVPLSSTNSPDESYRVRSMYFSSGQTSSSSNTGELSINPLDMSHLHPHMSHIPVQHKPEIPTIEVHKAREEPKRSERRYSVVSVTSVAGKIFLPNEELQTETNKHSCFQRSNISLIPMRRVSDVKKTPLDARRHRNAYSKNTDTVEMLVPYKFPKAAKCLHWVLVYIFRVKTIADSTDETEQEPATEPRVFYDYTDTSHPGSPARPEFVHPSQTISTDEPTTSGSIPITLSRTKTRRTGSDNSLNLERSGAAEDDDHIREHPIRKVSSINVASLYRSKFKKKNVTLLPPGTPGEGASSITSSKLSKILGRGRSMSFSWSRLTRPTKKSGLSSPISSPIMSPPPTTKDIEMKKVGTDIKTKETGESSSSQVGKSMILAPFSGELSPRPAVKYRKSILKRRLGIPVPKSAPIQQPRTLSQIERDRKTRISAFENDNNYLFSLALLFDGVRNEYDVEDDQDEAYPTADDILQPLTVTFTPTEEMRLASIEQSIESTVEPPMESTLQEPKGAQRKKRSIEPIQDAHEGFMEGSTTVDYISNWQEGSDVGDTGDASRITVYSEPWDIEEHYKEQLEFKEDISHI
ncbi:hypothetical protein BDF21DRAFT_497525 [Thamnidium elegans]|uniref:G-protein coupled receptors family 2 profile 2 domain-containing protein n=1 Tax=Thamnidium elegans TaxID=101142 RepID=A0A8H7W077_9FUNG|nr:hypothetical protein INT48_008454 [Thamnidium elegans]KAI8058787.1 hypothetical protein BDF21DRAFT_497525 [Thamnidium elegans]